MDVEARNLIPHAYFALSRTSLSLLTLRMLAAHLLKTRSMLVILPFLRPCKERFPMYSVFDSNFKSSFLIFPLKLC